MENGDGFVILQVSGSRRDQKLLVDNWDIRINLVSDMHVSLNYNEYSISAKCIRQMNNRTGDRVFSEWFNKSSHSE